MVPGTPLSPAGWEISEPPSEKLPFTVETYSDPLTEAVFARLERDGWHRASLPGEGDPNWTWRPSRRHPTLRLVYRGHDSRQGSIFFFSLDEHPGLLDGSVDWATWDAAENLLVARGGGVERYSLQGIERGNPDFKRSFEDLEPAPASPPR